MEKNLRSHWGKDTYLQSSNKTDNWLFNGNNNHWGYFNWNGTLSAERKALEYLFKNESKGLSLEVQWLRICPPVQETWVQSLTQEDPTCCRATKPMHHSYWACALEPTIHEKPQQWEAHALQLESTPCFPQLEKAFTQQGRPGKAKINKQFFFFN